MALVRIDVDHPTERTVKVVADALASGAVVAYPTDTVYGLGCSLEDKRAIERLYALKDKSRRRPLAFLLRDVSQASRYAQVDNAAFRVLRDYAPGPYCWVLESTKEVPRVLLTRRTTVGVRIPDQAFCQRLLHLLDAPIVTTSAAPGDVDEALTDPDEIDDRFRGQVDLVVDGGAGGSVPSTVVDLTGGEAHVLRPGKGPFPRS